MRVQDLGRLCFTVHHDAVATSLEIQVRPYDTVSYNPYLSGRGTTRAEDAQGTPTQSHISPSILVYEENAVFGCDGCGSLCFTVHHDAVATSLEIQVSPSKSSYSITSPVSLSV